MDALHIPAADIVGHSHGGAVALMLAARHPRRVRRLILFAPANPYSRSGDWMVRVYSSPWGRFAARVLPYLPARLQRLALADIHGGPDRILDSCLQEYVEVLRNSGSLNRVLAIIRGWFGEMARLKRALPRLVRAQIPTLLVWGDSDFSVSLTSGIRLHRKLPASELVVVPGGGHSVFEVNPEASNRIMLDWLSRVAPAIQSSPVPLQPMQPSPAPHLRSRGRQPVSHDAAPSMGGLSRNLAADRPFDSN
jgi:pimeloyl-ACP methyl ester carboxylesterase